jgi:hypothetical protein
VVIQRYTSGSESLIEQPELLWSQAFDSIIVAWADAIEFGSLPRLGRVLHGAFVTGTQECEGALEPPIDHRRRDITVGRSANPTQSLALPGITHSPERRMSCVREL